MLWRPSCPPYGVTDMSKINCNMLNRFLDLQNMYSHQSYVPNPYTYEDIEDFIPLAAILDAILNILISPRMPKWHHLVFG